MQVHNIMICPPKHSFFLPQFDGHTTMISTSDQARPIAFLQSSSCGQWPTLPTGKAVMHIHVHVKSALSVIDWSALCEITFTQIDVPLFSMSMAKVADVTVNNHHRFFTLGVSCHARKNSK